MDSVRTPKHFIQSLARGLTVLQAFSAERPRLGLQQLAQITGFNKTAVQRLTDTLMSLGFLGRNEYKEFYLEPKVLSLGFAYLNGSELRQLAETHLRAFSERTNCTVNLAVLDGTQVVILYRHEVQTFFNFALVTGSKLPAYCTAMGKVLLAGLDHDELERRVGEMELVPLTSYTITDRERFLEEIVLTRQRGYAVCDREGTLALSSLAVPLMDRTGRTAATINLSLDAEEVSAKDMQPLIKALLGEGERLSRLIGFDGVYRRGPEGGLHAG